MKPLPKSVIHVNFVAGDLLFDARPIWTALAHAVEREEVPAKLEDELLQKFGETAIHLATRHYVMKRAMEELKSALKDIYNEVPEPWGLPVADGYRLAIDAFLFEFRAYLDLLARFVHGVLSAIGKAPAQNVPLSSGKTVQITDRKGNLRPHDFLVYICDRLRIATDWYDFLSAHRNFFTHQGAPYCAIEDLGVRPSEFDLIIMNANIHDFQRADPSEFFRVSECQAVVDGIRALSAAAQHHLVEVLGR